MPEIRPHALTGDILRPSTGIDLAFKNQVELSQHAEPQKLNLSRELLLHGDILFGD
jgi:hypothetical protein